MTQSPQVPGNSDLVERICHKEQIGIWANEISTALSLGDFLKEDWTFDDSVDIEREIESQLRSIIASALTHPEFNVLDALSTAEARVEALEGAWQPIETAPKDGTVVLAVTVAAQKPSARVSWYENGKWVRIWKPEKFAGIGPAGWWPTHWRPLPAPPTLPTNAEAGHDLR